MQPTPPAPPRPAPAPPAEAPEPPDAPDHPGHPEAPAAPVLAGSPAADGPLAAAASPLARAVPRTAQELAGLRGLREELSNQLRSTQRRRDEVARQVRNTNDPGTRVGLEQRLAVLDRRMVQLETDIAETGRLLTSASPALLAGTQEPPRPVGRDRGPPEGVIAIVFIIFVLFPLAAAFARRYLRGPVRFGADPAAREAAERLGRLEQAVEAIAIEVERVSEGQRFVTRLLADARPPQDQAPAIGEYRARYPARPGRARRRERRGGRAPGARPPRRSRGGGRR